MDRNLLISLKDSEKSVVSFFKDDSSDASISANWNYPLLGSIMAEDIRSLLTDIYCLPIQANLQFEKEFLTSSFREQSPNSNVFASALSNSEICSFGNRSNTFFQNYFNETYTDEFLFLIKNEDFELGYTSKSELLFNKLMQINLLAARNWLNSVFLNYYALDYVVIGCIRLISRYNPDVIFPQGQTMALASLCYSNDEVIEWGIRAFENWGGNESRKILENISIKTKWLEEYRLDVLNDMKTIELHA